MKKHRGAQIDQPPPPRSIEGGDYSRPPTPRQLNRRHANFLQEFAPTSMDTRAIADFLASQKDENLYDFINLLDTLLELRKKHNQDAAKIEHTIICAEHIMSLYNICYDALLYAETMADKSDVKKQAQLEILDEEDCTPEEKAVGLTEQERDALLAVLETYTIDVPGLDDRDLEAIARFKHTLITQETEQAAGVVVSIRKAKGFRK